MVEGFMALGLAAAAMAAASTGILFRPGNWYRDLRKPFWTPPNVAFPLVWSLLYALMVIAAFRVASGLSEGQLPPGAERLAIAGLCAWSAQITLNAMWSPVFFGMRNGRVGMIVISCLWVAIVMTMGLFWAADSIAGVLMVPYLVWATYAGSLNAAILLMNPPSVFRDPAD